MVLFTPIIFHAWTHILFWPVIVCDWNLKYISSTNPHPKHQFDLQHCKTWALSARSIFGELYTTRPTCQPPGRKTNHPPAGTLRKRHCRVRNVWYERETSGYDVQYPTGKSIRSPLKWPLQQAFYISFSSSGSVTIWNIAERTIIFATRFRQNLETLLNESPICLSRMKNEAPRMRADIRRWLFYKRFVCSSPTHCSPRMAIWWTFYLGPVVLTKPRLSHSVSLLHGQRVENGLRLCALQNVICKGALDPCHYSKSMRARPRLVFPC